jgi:predicted DNA-binding transcriptional regulator AlpA
VFDMPETKAGAAFPRLLTRDQVLAIFDNDVADATFWMWQRELDFPAALEVGRPGGRTTKLRWIESEVLDWIMSRPRRKIGVGAFQYNGPRDADDKPTPPKRGRVRARKSSGASLESGGTRTALTQSDAPSTP